MAFWTNRVGQCKRFPPAVARGWPQTRAEDYCGEWREASGAEIREREVVVHEILEGC